MPGASRWLEANAAPVASSAAAARASDWNFVRDMRMVGNREWAEDVLQDAYLQVWRIADTYRASLSPPLAWLGVVVRSRALDFLRRRSAERLGAAQSFELDENDTADDAASPMDTAQ